MLGSATYSPNRVEEYASSRPSLILGKANPGKIQPGLTLSSIQHWQLRDLVHVADPRYVNHGFLDNTTLPSAHQPFFGICSGDWEQYSRLPDLDEGQSDDSRSTRSFSEFDESLITVVESSVLLSNNTSTRTVMELPYSPTTMSTAGPYVATGGSSAQLTLGQINSTFTVQTRVGSSITNHTHLAVTDDGVKLLVANNDKTVSILSVPSLEIETELICPFPANALSLSRCGKRLIAVGDSSQLWMWTRQSASVNDWNFVGGIRSGNDAGFGVAWGGQSDFMVATTHQCGAVQLFDFRKLCLSKVMSPACFASTQAVGQMKTSRAGLPIGAGRSVKWSHNSPLDLLLVGEHAGAVSIFDVRGQVDERPIETICARGSGISGVTWGAGCRRIYVGSEGSDGVWEYSVDYESRCRFASGSVMMH